MLLALLLSSLVSDVHAKTLTLSVEVERLDLAAAKLSKATGVAIRAEEPAASEIVFLNVKNLPVKVVLDNLAMATGSTLSRDLRSGGYIFSRSASKTKSYSLIEEARKLKGLSAWRARLMKGLLIPYDPQSLARLMRERVDAQELTQHEISLTKLAQTRARLQELAFADPGYRALARSIRNLNLNEVASMDGRSAFVYADHPVATQHKLPAGSAEAMEKVTSEQLVFGPVLRESPPMSYENTASRFTSDTKVRFWKGRDDELASEVSPFSRTRPYAKRPSSTILTILVSGWNRYQMELEMRDGGGGAVVRFTFPDISVSDEPYVPPSTHVLSIKPSPDTIAIWKRAVGSGESITPAIKQLKRFFDDPVINDPLQIGNQERLTALAGTTGKSVIACLTDECGQGLDSYFEPRPLALKFDGLTRIDSVGLILLKPKSFVRHWSSRMDRKLMAKFIHQDRVGEPSLLSFVRMVAHSVSRSYGERFAQLVNPDYLQIKESFSLGPRGFQELAASLTNQQLDRIGKGETIPYRELNAQQLGFAKEIVFGDRSNFSMMGSAGFTSDADGATKELPNGIQDGTGISGKVGDDRFLVFHDPASAPDDHFYLMSLEKEPNGFAWRGPPPVLPKGGLGTATYTINLQQVIVLRVGMKGDHFLYGRISAPLGKPLGKAVRFEELPKDVQVLASSKIKELEDTDG